MPRHGRNDEPKEARRGGSMRNGREFLRISTLAGAGLFFYKASERTAFPFAQSPVNLRKFVIWLPGLGPASANEIGQYLPVASPDTSTYPGTDHLHEAARQAVWASRFVVLFFGPVGAGYGLRQGPPRHNLSVDFTRRSASDRQTVSALA